MAKLVLAAGVPHPPRLVYEMAQSPGTMRGEALMKQVREQVEKALGENHPDAVIIRTLPNDVLKLKKNYSGKNPPYLHHDAADFLVSIGVKHLLVDLPSVDREEDDRKLLFHKAFWQFPHHIRKEATISELIFVPSDVADGAYLLNLQIASFELDASPSKPVLYCLL